MIRLPQSDQRLTIIGKTGSGKTWHGLWHLSRFDFSFPVIIFDLKGDENILSLYEIRGVKKFEGIKPPKKNGIYILSYNLDNFAYINQVLKNIYYTGHIFLFIDEASSMKQISSFQNILIQGRSRVIPTIQMVQRPSNVSRYAFSEAEFFQIFFISDKRDRDIIRGFTPLKEQDYQLIPSETHRSIMVDVDRGKKIIVKSIDSLDKIFNTIALKLRKKVNKI